MATNGPQAGLVASLLHLMFDRRCARHCGAAPRALHGVGRTLSAGENPENRARGSNAEISTESLYYVGM